MKAFERVVHVVTAVRVCLPDLRTAAVGADGIAAAGPAEEIRRALVLLESAERELVAILEATPLHEH